MFGPHDVNEKGHICYVKRVKKINENWVMDSDTFRKTVMLVGAMTGHGLLPLTKVPKKFNVMVDYYIKHVLKPVLEVHMLKLYPCELHKVIVHNIAASSHTAKKPAAYAADLRSGLGIRIEDNAEIPVKSPDTSPMDIFGLGYLKRIILRKWAITYGGLWKIMKRSWSGRGQTVVTRVHQAGKKD